MFYFLKGENCMEEIFIYNLNFAIAKNNRHQIGTISINKSGELKLSPSVVKAFNEEQLAELSRRVLDAYSLLLTGTVDRSLFSFSLKRGFDRYTVIYTIKGKENCIGYILDKNHHLNFQSNVPSYIRYLCVHELKGKKIRFYYSGKYYN